MILLFIVLFFVALVTTSEGKRRSLERARGKLARFPLEIHVSDTLRALLGRAPLAADKEVRSEEATPEDFDEEAGD